MPRRALHQHQAKRWYLLAYRERYVNPKGGSVHGWTGPLLCHLHQHEVRSAIFLCLDYGARHRHVLMAGQRELYLSVLEYWQEPLKHDVYEGLFSPLRFCRSATWLRNDYVELIGLRRLDLRAGAEASRDMYRHLFPGLTWDDPDREYLLRSRIRWAKQRGVFVR